MLSANLAALFTAALCVVVVVAIGIPLQDEPLKSLSDPKAYHVTPYYPAPFGGWVENWKESYRKAKVVVDSMTLAEKTNITAGTGLFMGSAPRVGFPQLCLGDGPSGIRQADNVTVFPCGITTGATFDKKLMYQRGVAIGKEARNKGVNVWLGPTVGPIGRKPKGGRNWEGFGADPVLQAVGARETIRGVQEQGVIATIKHFIGNEQEMYRKYNPFQHAYSSNIDDRTLHEVYMWPFAEGIRAGVGSVMMAYNAVNGTACSQHTYLINALLKDELGFQGFVQTDWIAHMSGVESAIAGLDLDMPGDTQVPLLGWSYWMYELSRAALNGSVPMERLNDMTTRVLAAWYQMGQDKNYPETNFDTNTKERRGNLYPGAIPDSPWDVVNHFVPVQEDHDVVARQVAQDAVTLLKNDGNLLPLNSSQALKVFGKAAQANSAGPNACSDRKCNRGTLGQGWGSGTADYMYLDDPISGIKNKTEEVIFFNRNRFSPTLTGPIKDTDIAIVFITSDSGENQHTVEGNHGDRDASGLYAWHKGDELVRDVAMHFTNVVVVAQTVGPLILEEWIQLPSVKSVLISHLPGQEAGRSLAEVLFGDVSPNGHLPYSITKRERDMPRSVTRLISNQILSFFKQPQDTFTEGLYIDYRWLNARDIQPRYAFGHGLSYTNFTLSNATITQISQMSKVPPARAAKTDILNYWQFIPHFKEAVAPKGFRMRWRYIYSWLPAGEARRAYLDAHKRYPYPNEYSTEQKPGPRAGGGEGGNPALWDVAYKLAVKVTNTGTKYSGKASVQAYLQFPNDNGYETPVLQLRDFEKTDTLAPGESATVELQLTRKDLSVWDVEVQDWVIPAVDGAYTVWLGGASDDLTVSCHVDVLKCKNGIRRM